MAHASAEPRYRVPPHERPLVDDVCAPSPRECADGEPGVETPAEPRGMGSVAAVLGSVRGSAMQRPRRTLCEGCTRTCERERVDDVIGKVWVL